MIRPATEADIPVILDLIYALAVYEREPDQAVATAQQLQSALGPHPTVWCLLAEEPTGPNSGPPDEGNSVVGFALWFLTFSTWLGTHSIYLEDLFVRPEARGGGHGRALLTALAAIAVERGHGRVEWSVLNWNEPAQGFYRRLGAAPQSEWTVWRLTGDALANLGGGDSPV